MTAFCVAFTAPSFRRPLVLLVGAILAKGRRTVTAILDTVGRAAPGPPASYHRVFSRAPWSFWPPATILASFVVALAEDHSGGGPVLVAGDDTAAEAKGPKLYGKGCHHDAVRSSHSHTVWRWERGGQIVGVRSSFSFLGVVRVTFGSSAVAHCRAAGWVEARASGHTGPVRNMNPNGGRSAGVRSSFSFLGVVPVTFGSSAVAHR